jgi:hypothetical protein
MNGVRASVFSHSQRMHFGIGAFVLFIFLSAVFSGCISQRATTESPTFRSTAPSREKSFMLPPGWFQQELSVPGSGDLIRLVNGDRSAVMVLKELHSSAATKAILVNEELYVLGNISLQEKLAQPNIVSRIIRTPSALEGDPRFCLYIYAKDYLLRRVLVFRSEKRMYELELRQEKSDASLTLFSKDQLLFAKAVLGSK